VTGTVTGTDADAHAASLALCARDVKKSNKVGDRTIEVLHGVDLDLAHGERLSLMGSSGAGKSTLLHVLGMLDRPTSGRVLVDGEEVWKLSTAERAARRNAKIGFVFQFYHLIAELDAVENVLMPAMIAPGFGGRAKEHRDKAVAMLEKFGLGERLAHRPGQLSGGERQRVAIARALFLDPPVVIADEPTGNLDSHTGERVLELLFDEQRERRLSLLLVTHDERVAARCERMVTMEDGRVRPPTA
jgi:lipoprotein-releasing system ATP-binding protein